MPTRALAVESIKFTGIQQPKPVHRFAPNLEVIRLGEGEGYLATLKGFSDFWVVKSVRVSQPKSMHGLSPNFQDMFTPRGSRADYVFGGTWQQLCHFLYNFSPQPPLISAVIEIF